MSEALLSISISFRCAYLRSSLFKVTMSRKGQTKYLRFGRRDTSFWVIFLSRTRQMTLEHFLNDPKRKIFECRENAENSVKNGSFRPSKHQNSVIFQDIYLKFCTHIHRTGFFTHIRLFEHSKVLSIFENTSCDYF